MDLRPGRSFIEYCVARGLQTFLLSWRNPGRAQRDWDLDTYAARPAVPGQPAFQPMTEAPGDYVRRAPGL